MSLTGQTMLESTASLSHKLQVSTLPKGLYFVEVSSGSGKKIQKLVIE